MLIQVITLSPYVNSSNHPVAFAATMLQPQRQQKAGLIFAGQSGF